MKNATDVMIGTPNPPFRMMAPSGAPMRKKMMQHIDKTNFL